MKEPRLPWNGREGMIYGLTIAMISCFLMSTFNISKTFGGLDAYTLIVSLKCFPILLIIVMMLMKLIVGPVATYGVRRFTEPTDGFNTMIVFNIILCVTMLSMSMSIIAPTVGGLLSGNLDFMEVLRTWPHIWPVNFCVAFWIEMLVAQPFARMIMKRMHSKQMTSA